MKHATVQLGEYKVPLIGIPTTSVEERCDHCRKVFPLQQIELVNIYFFCKTCLPKIRFKERTNMKATP